MNVQIPQTPHQISEAYPEFFPSGADFFFSSDLGCAEIFPLGAESRLSQNLMPLGHDRESYYI